MTASELAQELQVSTRTVYRDIEALGASGVRIDDEGRIAWSPTATTLSDAARHASSLRSELRRRGTHPEKLRYCTEEILAKNAFHASLEAVKLVADRLRQLTGEHLDGARLVDAVLMPGGGRSG